MTDNVVPLRGGTGPHATGGLMGHEPPVDQPEINVVLVDELERLLRLAKAGELLGMAGAYKHRDRSVGYSFAGAVGGFAMLGGLDVVRERLLRQAGVDDRS